MRNDPDLRLRYLIVVLFLAACGGLLGKPTVGGESHFLRHCSQSCGAGLECVSGVCTRGCRIGTGKCSDLNERAMCTDASIEPGALAVCDVSCDTSAGCRGLGVDFTCEAGFCRGPALAGEPSQGTGGSSSAAAGAGSGGEDAVASCMAYDTGACPLPQVCVDVADDGCDGRVDAACPGVCEAVFRTPVCSELGAGALCPADFFCTTDPWSAYGSDPQELCVPASAIGECSIDAESCGDGFDCMPVGERGDCAPNRVDCFSPWTCDMGEPEACPYGYGRSRIDITDGVARCFGPCVAITHCGCTNDGECPEGSVCDRGVGSCVERLPWQPAPECLLPYDAGPCNGNSMLFALVDGVCQQVTYGGCEGNANRFGSLEECLAICQGLPIAGVCPEGRVRRNICTECGVVGGCGMSFMACAKQCDSAADCDTLGYTCFEGVCQARYCE